MVLWPRILAFLLVGYLTSKRSFAYLGVPPLFIGEIVLGAFLVLKPRVVLGTWAVSLFRVSPLNELGLAMLVFMAYGVWQVGRGVLSGHPLIYTMKFFIFNYYTLYMFLGMWVALRTADLLPRLIRVLAWVNGIYGLLFLVALRYVPIYIPGDGAANDVPLFSPPSGQVVVILGLLCFEHDLRRVWFILLLNIVVTLVWQVRAEWLGLALGIFAWGLFTGRLGRVVAIGFAGLAVLGAIELADIRLAGRSGDSVSFSENLARVIAPIDLELAKKLSPNAAWHAGTAEWREEWWEQIWLSIHSTPMLTALGHGYGFDLYGLAPQGRDVVDVRTPHSVFHYALGYTGWVGVALFAMLQWAILRLLWRSYRLTGQPAGVVLWVMGMAMAFFQESFETPYRAIPFYLLTGMGIAPGLQGRRATGACHARTQLLSVAGR
jgi:hypothetical protein